MIFTILIIALLVYAVLISRSQALGKLIYTQTMRLEQLIAGLKVHTVTVNDMPISYYRSAQHSDPVKQNRPVMLLLHGFSADKSIWHRFAMQAKDDFDLIIPDLLGHGETPYNKSQSYAAIDQTKMLCKFLSALNITEYVVVGNSMGGMVAMQLMQKDSARLKKAILLDPAGAKSEFALSMQRSGMNPFIHQTKQHFFDFYNRSMAKPPFIPPSVLNYLAHAHYVDRQQELSHMFSDFFDVHDFFDKPIDIKPHRLMIVWGHEDQLLPVADAEVWENLTQCQPIIYSGLGHMPMVEAPKQTYKDCKIFIDQRLS